MSRLVERLRMSQFDGTIQDCEKVLKVIPHYIKAIFLKARALYRLRRFKEAQNLSRDLLVIDPTSRDGKDILESSTKRVLEANSGNYDFRGMELRAKKDKYPRLDYADYVGPAEV